MKLITIQLSYAMKPFRIRHKQVFNQRITADGAKFCFGHAVYETFFTNHVTTISNRWALKSFETNGTLNTTGEHAKFA